MNELYRVLTQGDHALMVLVLGFGLILWAGVGATLYPGDVIDYQNMFKTGSIFYWFLNHVVVGMLMLANVAWHFPTRLAQLTGSWLVIAWSWSTLARVTEVSTQQTGATVAAMYVIVGIFILHRSITRHA